MKTKDVNIWRLLQVKFPATEYALLQEVRNAAGFYASRSADGVAMNLWPSRGLEVHGIEIKSIRTDWRKELKNPVKAEAIYKYCDRWWIVDESGDAVKESEVPVTWGFMQIRNGRLVTVKDAPKLKPKQLDRHFVAALLKRATSGMIPIGSIQEKIEAAELKGRHEKSTYTDNLEKEISDLKGEIKQFEEMSGVRIGHYDSSKIGGAVKELLNGGATRFLEELINVSEVISRTSARVDSAITELKQISNNGKTEGDTDSHQDR